MEDHLYSVPYMCLVLHVGLPDDFEEPNILGADDLLEMEEEDVPNSARSNYSNKNDVKRSTELRLFSEINDFFGDRDIEIDDLTATIR